MDAQVLNPVDQAIRSRRSVRAFLPTQIPEETIREILESAARAPSGTNTQPWRVYVLRGEAKRELSRRIVSVYNDPDELAKHKQEYAYYPINWASPFIERRRKVGWDLYSLLGIEKGNKPAMHAQHSRNYEFFGAPVGFMFTIDRILEKGSWLDYGMFLENIMVSARGHGLDTCPQAAFTQFHRIIAEFLRMPENETFVCGMSLGYADNSKIENTLVTDREPVDSWATFVE